MTQTHKMTRDATYGLLGRGTVAFLQRRGVLIISSIKGTFSEEVVSLHCM